MQIFYVDEAGCTGMLPSAISPIHVHLQYDRIRDLFGERLKRMQFRYQDANQWWHGGVTVSDGMGRQKGGLLFAP
jgi:hypothetical protein